MKGLKEEFGILKKNDIPLVRPNKIPSKTTVIFEFNPNDKKHNPEETNSCKLYKI